MPRIVSRPNSSSQGSRLAVADLSPAQTLLPALRASKALDPVLLDLRAVSDWVDHFIICHGTSARHLRTIADMLADALQPVADRPLTIEGTPESGWLLIDEGDLVVHIFDAEHREFYDLEHLWGDSPRVELDARDVSPRDRDSSSAD